ncbi:MAG: alpha/beta hydrolase [Acidimicrobiales bacterium]
MNVRPGVSEASRRIVEHLWTLPGSAGVGLEQWREQAAHGERTPWPSGMRTDAVAGAGVALEWTWFDGTDLAGGPVMVVIHGGGFVLCSIGTHRILGARLARAVGGRSLMVGYRLAPEHPFPAALDDCVAAVRWLYDQGVGPDRVVLFGDSAGGNLCVEAALALDAAGAPRPRAIVLASPLTDLSASGSSLRTNAAVDPFSRLDDVRRFAELYLDGVETISPLASPLFADLRSLPPLLIQVGLHETLLDDSLRFYDAARAAGVHAEIEVIEGAFHTWLGYGDELPEAAEAIDRMARWVRSVA